jgi:hypothetical protein
VKPKVLAKFNERPRVDGICYVRIRPADGGENGGFIVSDIEVEVQ